MIRSPRTEYLRLNARRRYMRARLHDLIEVLGLLALLLIILL